MEPLPFDVAELQYTLNVTLLQKIKKNHIIFALSTVTKTEIYFFKVDHIFSKVNAEFYGGKKTLTNYFQACQI